ncbi:hypothetical protein QQZ08_010110 [Neonectria magnoliae]|uniref:Uncharacterized protein n=1 Tax=Neonectria magnoliae TaxID=2732573 RepID=A0ABR1HJ43_9HYPO
MNTSTVGFIQPILPPLVLAFPFILLISFISIPFDFYLTMAPSPKRLADVDRSKTEPIDFDDSKLGKVKPILAKAEGFTLSSKELRDVFGMRPNAFGTLPRRIVIPDFKATPKADGYQVSGYLYIVEPVAWVPRVRHGVTIPLSVFKKPSVKEEKPVHESALNKPGVAAQLITNTSGALIGTKAEPLTNNAIHSTATKDGLEVRDNLPPFPIHQLTVFPMLRVRALKQQRIELHLNASKKLTWAKTETAGYWDKTVVSAKRISPAVGSFQLHPLPLQGPDDLSKLLFIQPVPRLLDNGELEVTTLISRSGWPEWYLWEDTHWVDAAPNRFLMVAAPQNQTAFQAMTTWAPLNLPDDPYENDGEGLKDPHTISPNTNVNSNTNTNTNANNNNTNNSQPSKPNSTAQSGTTTNTGVPKTGNNDNANTNTNTNSNTNVNSLEPTKPKPGPVVDSACTDTKSSDKPNAVVNPTPGTSNTKSPEKPTVAVNPLPGTTTSIPNTNANTNTNTNGVTPLKPETKPITETTPKSVPSVTGPIHDPKPVENRPIPTNANTNVNINDCKPEDQTPIKNDTPNTKPKPDATKNVDSKPIPANTHTNTNVNDSKPTDLNPTNKSPPKTNPTPTSPPVVNPIQDSKPCDNIKDKPAENKPPENKPTENKPTENKPTENKPVPTNTNTNTNINDSKPKDPSPINNDLPKTDITPKSPHVVNPVQGSKPCDNTKDKPLENKPVENKPTENKPTENKPTENKPTESKPAESKPVPTNTNTNTNINDSKPKDPSPINNDLPKTDTTPKPPHVVNPAQDSKPCDNTKTKPTDNKPVPTNTNTNNNTNGLKPEDPTIIKKDPPKTNPTPKSPPVVDPIHNPKPIDNKPTPTNTDANGNTNTNTNINGLKPEGQSSTKKDPTKTDPSAKCPPVNPVQDTKPPVDNKSAPTNTNSNTNTNINGLKPKDSTATNKDPLDGKPKATTHITPANTNVNNNTNTNTNGNNTISGNPHPNSYPFHGTIILHCPCCPPDSGSITVSFPTSKPVVPPKAV